MMMSRKCRLSLAASSLFFALAACGDAPESSVEAVDIEAPVLSEENSQAVQEASIDLVADEPAIPTISGDYAPRDECTDLEGATEFRGKIAAAVAEQSAMNFIKLVEDDVTVGYPFGGGKYELNDRLIHPQMRLWDRLDELLPLGCAVDAAGDMVIPWSFAQNIPTDGDYSAQIVQGDNVPLLAEPKEDSEVLAHLSWAVVDLVDSPKPPEDMAEVHIADGSIGYVPWDKIRKVGDYRLTIKKHDDGWKIAIFSTDDEEE